MPPISPNPHPLTAWLASILPPPPNARPLPVLVGCILLQAIGTGCAALAPLADKSAGWAADAVHAYCSELTAAEREAFGALVRIRSAPDDVRVICASDQ